MFFNVQIRFELVGFLLGFFTYSIFLLCVYKDILFYIFYIVLYCEAEEGYMTFS